VPTRGGLLTLVNRSRGKAGLRALRVSAALTRAAQAKADEMARLGYFDHNSPEGRTPWDFLAAEGYRYSDAGENLAAGWRTDEEVMRGWMGSEGHRANILSRAFQETGIGIARGAKGDLVVEMFGTPAGGRVIP
jgi:uncharacterized protein YkwD